MASLLLRGIRRRSWPPGSRVATVEWTGWQIDDLTHLHLDISPATTPTQKRYCFLHILLSALA
jgi:hypothetical protein